MTDQAAGIEKKEKKDSRRTISNDSAAVLWIIEIFGESSIEIKSSKSNHRNQTSLKIKI